MGARIAVRSLPWAGSLCVVNYTIKILPICTNEIEVGSHQAPITHRNNDPAGGSLPARFSRYFFSRSECISLRAPPNAALIQRLLPPSST